MNIILTFENKR